MAVESVLEIDRWRRRYSTKRFADYYARDYLWQFQALIAGVTEGAMSQGRMASLNLEPRRRSAVYNSLPNRSSVRSNDRSLWYSTRNWGWKWCRVATGNREHVECDGNQLKTAPPRPYIIPRGDGEAFRGRRCRICCWQSQQLASACWGRQRQKDVGQHLGRSCLCGMRGPVSGLSCR